MITPPTDIYWMVRVEGEAAEYVTGTLSPGAMNDIKEAVLISTDFTNDIQATLSLDDAVLLISAHLSAPAIEHSLVNPLYIPSTVEQIDQVMEGDAGSESVEFVGMDGSPFTMKLVDVSVDEKMVIDGKVVCKPFELPSYNQIIRGQTETRLQ